MQWGYVSWERGEKSRRGRERGSDSSFLPW